MVDGFKISARTVLELGSELISSDIIAFYELIKNGFDAQTQSGVDITFDVVLRRNAYMALRRRISDRKEDLAALKTAVHQAINVGADAERRRLFLSRIDASRDYERLLRSLDSAQAELNSITVADTGTGMSLKDLSRTFLVIGTASRKKEVDAALRAGSTSVPYLGEKGIGRLSAMRLGNRLRVETARKSDTKINLLEVDWNRFSDLDAMLDDIAVAPTVGDAKPSAGWSGTRIIVSDLAEDWTQTRLRDMAEYDFARLTDPFVDQKERPRIGLIWNGERIAIPWMNRRLLESAHASLSGEYRIVDGKPELSVNLVANDLGFPHPVERRNTVLRQDDLESVVIGTSQSIDDAALVSVGPFSFEAHWYNRRRLSGVDGLGEKAVVKELQEKWSGILLFRDRFRVFPYGDDEDDWLGLDRKALRRSGYVLNKTQFVGRVSITRTGNPNLVDQTNREGLRETPEQTVLLEVMRDVIRELFWHFLRDVEVQYKQQVIDLSDAKDQVDKLENRAKAALKRLQRMAPKEAQESVSELEQTFLEFSEFAERARTRIAQVEQESRQMVEMAGVGLMVEVVAHELARASENALAALEALRGKALPPEISAQMRTLQAEMKSISKRVRILDPLSIAGRQRRESFDLNGLVREILEAHTAQFERQGITLEARYSSRPLPVKAVKGMIVQILENLISNSIYWLEMRSERERSFRPKISISVESSPPTVVYEDNGRGIAPENRENVFKAFFSLKEKSKRRGLGLFIAREAAQYHGGSLVLSDEVNPETGRLHRFVLEIPGSDN